MHTEKKQKLVLVEDETFLGEMYVKKFEEEGFEMVWVDEGGKALDTIRTVHPDAVILDILLPQISGFAILQKMKQEDALRHIPVVILTNLSEAEDQERGKHLGAVSYILKVDATPEEVVRQVKEALHNHT